MIAGAVLPGRRVVVVAEQQHLVDRRADALFGRLDQAEPQSRGENSMP